MSILHNYRFRNFIKELILKIHTAREYGTNHPYTAIRRLAHESTADFILRTCPRALATRTPRRLMDLSLSRVSLDGLYVECGVFKGQSITYIAEKNPSRELHGFDSFEGLPEDWVHNPKGTFSTNGKMPKVPKNVWLWKGFFQETLPVWCRQYPGAIAFLHIDCDLRSSTETVLNELADKIGPGAVIVFDDYFNFPGWEEDAHAVFTQFLTTQNLSVEYIGYGYKELAVIVQ